MKSSAIRATRLARTLVAALAVVASVGCASAPVGPQAPSEVVRAQIVALEAGDERAAARWLTPAARARAPLWPGAAGRPSAASVSEIGRSARWDDGPPIELVRGAPGWQIRRGVLGLAHADSPERALDAFGRALVARDWSMVLELVPTDMKAQWTASRLGDKLGASAAWRALGEALAAGRYTLTTRDADRARARVDGAAPGTEVVVERDGSGWKVFDVTPRSGYLAP
ncbi:MAG: hypothetical protein IT385_07075 [Deltaproteobacteria bacterium]|nr:hypothetical protein [Deltaproteobacteria bacterium]